jgi:protein gp37
MGETTKIGWTHSTVNVWHGCTKVSAGCTNCYAEVSTPVRVKRAAGLEVWGPKAARSETKGWRAQIRKMQRAAVTSGQVHRVFAQSLSDTFEDYQGGALVDCDGGRIVTGLDGLRAEFFAAIEAASALTFQLLTKRPENVARMVPASWMRRWPRNVWIGCTAEDQPRAEERIPHLLRLPAPVRFVSVEPQLGPVDLTRLRFRRDHDYVIDALDGRYGITEPRTSFSFGLASFGRIGWVIVGGESGPRARTFDLAWMRSLRDQCRAAGVPMFAKQLGANARSETPMRAGASGRYVTVDSHGADEDEWPADLRGLRAFPGDVEGEPLSTHSYYEGRVREDDDDAAADALAARADEVREQNREDGR